MKTEQHKVFVLGEHMPKMLMQLWELHSSVNMEDKDQKELNQKHHFLEQKDQLPYGGGSIRCR